MTRSCKTICDGKHATFMLKSLKTEFKIVIPPSPYILYAPEKPGSENYIKLNDLWVYVAVFSEGGGIEEIKAYYTKDGTLNKTKKPSSRDRPEYMPFKSTSVYLYVSHRNDLKGSFRNHLFKKDRTRLPLIGPFEVPEDPKKPGEERKWNVDIWEQKDWVIVHSDAVNGKVPHDIKMADGGNEYKIGSSWSRDTINYSDYNGLWGPDFYDPS